MKGFLHTDGGARGNPGPAAGGIVLRNEDKKTIDVKGAYLGIETNNVAEYSALILGLKLAKEHNITELECFLDSELVVRQLKGIYRVKNENLKNHFDKVKILEKEFKKVTYSHVKREYNKEADAIVNKVLDLRNNG